jgi:hypothetical protein
LLDAVHVARTGGHDRLAMAASFAPARTGRTALWTTLLVVGAAAAVLAAVAASKRGTLRRLKLA